MISELLYKAGLIVAVTLLNVFISFTCAVTAMFYCIHLGYGKTATLAITIAIAILVTAYIRFNHLIIQRIRNGEKQ